MTLKFPALAEEINPPGEVLTPGTALVIDDDPAYLASASEALERLGYVVFRAGSFSEGSAQLHQQPRLDLVLSDLNLDNGASGWEILQLAHRLFPKCRLALMSTRETYRVPKELEAAARPAKLPKPFTDSMMRRLVASS